MKTLLTFLFTLFSFFAYSQYVIEYTYQPHDSSEYVIEYTYQPQEFVNQYDSTGSFDVILNNYIRDFKINLYDLELILSKVASGVEGYPIKFQPIHINAFRDGSVTPLPMSTIAIRNYIREQYENQ